MTLQELDIIIEIALMAVAIPSAILAIYQLLEMRKQRAAEMSWKIFEKYSSEELQSSRNILYIIKNNFSNANQYQSKYHDQPLGSEAKTQDQLVRYRLRYFHQIGLLAKKKLLDIDLLFGLIGHALKDDYETLKIILDSSRQAHNAPNLYKYFDYLYVRFLMWEKQQNEK